MSKQKKTVKVAVLLCGCGCGEYAISIGDTRITDNDSGGPWRIAIEQDIPLATIAEAAGITSND